MPVIGSLLDAEAATAQWSGPVSAPIYNSHESAIRTIDSSIFLDRPKKRCLELSGARNSSIYWAGEFQTPFFGLPTLSATPAVVVKIPPANSARAGCYASFYARKLGCNAATPVFPEYFVMQVVMHVSMQGVCGMHA